MQTIGVIFVRDPIIALDLTEILSLQFPLVQLMSPQSAAEAIDMLVSAAFIVTDKKGLQSLEGLEATWAAPTIFVGSKLPAHSYANVVKLPYPFTTQTVTTALDALDLLDAVQKEVAGRPLR